MNRLLFVLALLLNITLQAQPPKKFHTSIGGNGYDYAYDVKQTTNGGYILAGSTSSFGFGNTDVYLLKLDSMGQIEFQKTYGGYDNESAKAVVQLTDGSYVIAGYTSSKGFGGYDAYIIKTDNLGNLIWEKTFGGTDWDFCNSMVATADGGFILAGSTTSFGYGNTDGYIIKLDATGTEQWHKIVGGTKADEFKSIIQTTDGGYALAGQTKSYNDSLGDAWVFKLNANGDSINSFYNNLGGADGVNDICELQTGEFLLGGYFTINNKKDAVFYKTNPFGLIIFQFIDGQPGTNEEFYKVGISNSMFGTYTALENSHENGISFKSDVKLLLFNQGGYYVNGGAIGDSQDDYCYSFCKTKENSKGYVAVGYTNSYNSNLSDCFLIKYDSLLSVGLFIIDIDEIDIKKNNFSIYPNPTNNIITIKAISNEIGKIEILNIEGSKIYETFSLNENKINIDNFPQGVYLVIITDKNNLKSVHRIIKI